MWSELGLLSAHAASINEQIQEGEAEKGEEGKGDNRHMQIPSSSIVVCVPVWLCRHKPL